MPFAGLEDVVFSPMEIAVAPQRAITASTVGLRRRLSDRIMDDLETALDAVNEPDVCSLHIWHKPAVICFRD